MTATIAAPPANKTRWRWWLLGYVLLAIVGVQIALQQPVFFAPDEGAHYLRAYEISRRHWLNTPDKVGTSMACGDFYTVTQKYHLTARTQPKAQAGKDDPNCTVLSINTAGAYSMVPYLPAAIALRLTRAQPVENRLRWARISNAVVWLAVIVCSLAWLQRGQLLMGSLVLLPGFFWQITMLSSDGATLASSFGLVCWIVGLRQRGQRLSNQDLAITCLLAALLGASKGVYAPLALLSWGLWSQLDDRPRWWRCVLLSLPCLITVSVLGVFAAVADKSLVYLGNGAQPSEQLAYILANPLLFIQTVCNSVISIDMVGLVAPNYTIPHALNAQQVTWLSMVSLAVLTANTDWGLDRPFKILAGLLFPLCIVGAFAPLYLTYTPIGADAIWGIQGRYYLPMLPLLALAISFNMSSWDRETLVSRIRWAAIIPLLGLMMAVWRAWDVHG